MSNTCKISKLVTFLVLLLFTVSIPITAHSKDKIVIGAARPLSGYAAFYEANAFGPIYKMWVDEVNAKGGIYVKQYKKKLPIELKIYDNKSDIGTTTRLMEKLILQDKVDFILPPASTAFLFAAAGVANKHKYILIGAEGGATTAEKQLDKMPYLFMVLNYSNHYQCPVLADIYADLGVKSVAIIYVDDLHGIEYQGVGSNEFMSKGIEVKMIKGIPMDAKDASHLLKEAKNLNVDALVSFTYPELDFLITSQLMELGINFKSILFGPGANFEVYRATFGDKVIEGVMGEGAWNEKSSKAHKDFVERYLKRYKRETLDWWGHNVYYAGCQVLEQAIEKAGTLNQKKIRDIIATQKFDTILGKTYFKNQLLARECYAGQIGQWQNGVFEVIDPGKKRTAKPIYPKPDFPKK
ncbi:MAG: amino acid ABC transporter substrate-binding protein [Spirochaetes bacterium]|nr:amino acid ABC transporter substrate-binding protein [Spirochaetota bacterium]